MVDGSSNETEYQAYQRLGPAVDSTPTNELPDILHCRYRCSPLVLGSKPQCAISSSECTQEKGTTNTCSTTSIDFRNGTDHVVFLGDIQ